MTDVATSTGAACGLDLDRDPVCWGSASLVETPSGQFDTIEIGSCACALNGSEVTCWGSDYSDTVSREIGPVKALSMAGAVCSIGLDDLVTCWGSNDDGQATPPSTPMRALRAGRTGTSCGVDLEGGAVCWGAKRSGTALAPPGAFTVVDAGVNVTCGLHEDGTLECWGDTEQALAHPERNVYGVFSGIRGRVRDLDRGYPRVLGRRLLRRALPSPYGVTCGPHASPLDSCRLSARLQSG